MELLIDFLQLLELDMALKILTCLEDSADLIRASAVSRYWQNLVISHGLSKQLCIKRFPQIASITHVVEASHNSEPAVIDASTDAIDHHAYASLFRAMTAFPQTYCIEYPVSASSTDDYPRESIVKTLDPQDNFQNRSSYWSSKGSDDANAPETLIYKLTANLCVITEINLRPFQALFQLNSPIYSSKSVRFRMGHPKSWNDIKCDFLAAQECADDKFIWTYTSQEFRVAQENKLQCFKLPEPVICIGGFLQIELLGRVQKQESDDRYYICVAHVQAIGRKLSPAFSAEFSERSNSVSLNYDCEEYKRLMQRVSTRHNGSLSTSTRVIPIVPIINNGYNNGWRGTTTRTSNWCRTYLG